MCLVVDAMDACDCKQARCTIMSAEDTCSIHPAAVLQTTSRTAPLGTSLSILTATRVGTRREFLSHTKVLASSYNSSTAAVEGDNRKVRSDDGAEIVS